MIINIVLLFFPLIVSAVPVSSLFIDYILYLNTDVPSVFI